MQIEPFQCADGFVMSLKSSRNISAQLVEFNDEFRMSFHTKVANLILVLRSPVVVMKNR